MMDANTLVLSALKTGAIANTRYSTITPRKSKDTYQALKSLLLNRFSGQGQSEAAQLIRDWDTNYPKPEAQEQMMEELEEVHFAEDDAVLTIANQLILQLEAQYPLHNSIDSAIGGPLAGKPASEYQSIITPWSSGGTN